ncbi:extracellular solute-binding protein, family 1 [Thermosinus carboxydivorans Nor1]|uniref:Extracellular solute-binding protein, family 1 n=1 Tax=Thermosinus carboxydivorans Nor1 TaxID=401526 RepID=A1HQC4_9FIRM|nr:substrate-binding domain-containing protein [Thermosinus carboxydivorans]EAX47731.1 extracellular solute-binding protein, family 1 [Thermosinus carboxydivorans Nor1]
MQNKKMLLMPVLVVLLLMLAGCGAPAQQAVQQQPAKPARPDIILATTTSTQDSGLLDVLIPAFEKKTGYRVKTVAVGSGQAIAMGEKGEADVLLTHAPDAEKKIVAAGAVSSRRLVMHNDFIIIGPASDQAKIKGKRAVEALAAIAASQAGFVSRGDNSGTHQLEKKLWAQAAIKPAGAWYYEAGAGMGQTLSIANEKKGYTITDRATYLAQRKNISLEILVEGDAKLLNIYHVMEVNGDKFNKVNREGAKAFADFLLSAEGQQLIGSFGKDKFGQPLFFADGGKTEKDLGL